MTSRRLFIKSLISLFGALPAIAIPNRALPAVPNGALPAVPNINPPQKQKINIILIKNDVIIGRALSIDIVEQRTISPDFLIASPIFVSGELSKILFNKSKIEKIFNNNSIGCTVQKEPFDIIIVQEQFATEIKNVWLSKDPDIQYKTDDFVIINNIEWQAECIKAINFRKSNII
jgi:hypothetical protein